MSDSYTTTSTNSYGSKIGTSIKGAFFGVLLIVGSIVMIFINERNQAQTMRLIGRAADSAIEIEPVQNVDYEDAIVYTSGPVLTDEVITDEAFNVSLDDALHYRRKVEMYQWQETTTEEKKDKLGGSEEVVTTVSYDKVWLSSHIDSQHFSRDGYENPDSLPIESLAISAQQVSVGELDLSQNMIRRSEDTGFTAHTLDELPSGYTPTEGGIYIYQGKKYKSPEIGDVRVQFEYVSEGTFSMIGEYNNGIISEHVGKKQSLGIISRGTVTVDELIELEKSKTRTIGWIFRAVGFALMYMGLVMILDPLRALASILPFMGRMVGGLSRFVTFIIALVMSLLVASIAWVIHRPIIGIILIIITLGIAFLVSKFTKKKKEA